MNYYLYCNSKGFTKAHLDAIKEYTKRLSSYCKIQINANAKKIKPDNFSPGNHQIWLITKSPSTYSSEEFANFMKTMEASGKSNVHIYIGYEEETIMDAYSSTEVKMHILSLSNSDLSNQTLCVLFVEQLYRGYTIIQGKTYHK